MEGEDEVKHPVAPACINSSPARGGGPSQTVEGHVQGITTPEGHEDSPGPLPHPADGPPPHSGEDSFSGPAGDDWPKASSPRWRGSLPPSAMRHQLSLAPHSRGQSSPAMARPAG